MNYLQQQQINPMHGKWLISNGSAKKHHQCAYAIPSDCLKLLRNQLVPTIDLNSIPKHLSLVIAVP